MQILKYTLGGFSAYLESCERFHRNAEFSIGHFWFPVAGLPLG